MNESDPIVVGGCYRSGTSLVRRLLDSHPRIHCGPEVKFFRDFYADYLGVEDPIAHLRFMATARSLLAEEELLDVFGAALVEIHERAARNAGKPRWADKAPENVVFLDRWQRLLGDDWLFVHVVRSPLDTLASIEEVGFPRSIPAGLDDRIDLYLEYADAGLRFGAENPHRYVRLLYEDLVADPEAGVRSLMASLGERFHPEQLELGSSPPGAGLEDPKVEETTGVHRDSVGRWRDVLDSEEAETITVRTAEVWSRLDPAGRHLMRPAPR